MVTRKQRHADGRRERSLKEAWGRRREAAGKERLNLSGFEPIFVLCRQALISREGIADDLPCSRSSRQQQTMSWSTTAARLAELDCLLVSKSDTFDKIAAHSASAETRHNMPSPVHSAAEEQKLQTVEKIHGGRNMGRTAHQSTQPRRHDLSSPGL
jgi:hypothetical protein